MYSREMGLKKIVFALTVCMCLVLWTLPSFATDKPLVVFANPGGKDDAFYSLVTGFMQAAADDLGMDLKVFYGDRNHVLIDENVQAIFRMSPQPDYIVGMNARGSGEVMLKLGEEHGVKTVFFNQSFLAKERTLMGMPGQRFKNWLFEFLPDDIHSGYLLGKTLVDTALDKGLTDKDGQLQMVAVSGHEQSAASSLRVRGLRKAVAEYDNVHLDQVVRAGWKQDKARNQALGLIGRYPEISVFWSASDVMAIGVLEAIKRHGKRPGEDILTGGVDWANKAMPLVKNGEFTASVGGHFMDGGWALVMLYDLIHGVSVPPISRSRFSVLTKDNVDIYTKNFGDNDWSQIDFQKFSKHLNPELKAYNFGLEAVLEQVR